MRFFLRRGAKKSQNEKGECKYAEPDLLFQEADEITRIIGSIIVRTK